jgi:hypothetical protein
MPVTDNKLGRFLNDNCVLLGWARDLCFFLCIPMHLKIILTKFYSPTWSSLVLAIHLSKHFYSHWAVIFSKWDGQTLTLHNFTIREGNCLAHCCDCLYGEYWFRLSRYVYDGNRSFASYTKTKLVESAVWCLLTRDDDVEQRVLEQVPGNRIKIPEHGSGSELLFLFWTINKQGINENETNK